jgi:RIO kinase 1
MFRNLRNDSLYRMGRNALDDQGKATRARRELLAMRKRTDFGQELLHGAWLANEFRTMQRLYEAGAAVPRPISHSENAILMEYLGEAGRPAQALHHVALRAEEARPLFDQLIHNIDLMLSVDCVHADLSAHNILYWDGAVKIIDFPQAVDPYTNPEAYPLFARDVLRVCQYFAHYGITTDPARLARDLWARHIPTA